MDMATDISDLMPPLAREKLRELRHPKLLVTASAATGHVVDGHRSDRSDPKKAEVLKAWGRGYSLKLFVYESFEL